MSGESKAPTPTHFIVRSVAGESLMAGPVSIDGYYGVQGETALAIQTQASLVGTTVVMEFLKETVSEGLSSYEVLYGVPVEVR